ncbi:hypothetical protein ACJMK2_036166 [Sinanodonta woodiana]|uniref:Uncharacterized protein n=1 Tax=Sinanodonta woodiana TaxID=1069815 RepID=A0ABD3WIF0_SINWO
MKLFLLAVTIGLVSCQVMPGGVLHQDPKDPMFQKPAQVAATYTDDQNTVSLSAQYGQNYEVVAAATQVVAGILYKMTLKFTSADHHVTLCEVSVLEQAWLHFIGLSGTPHCHGSKRQLAGGYHHADSNSQAVQSAAVFAVDAMNKQSNSLYKTMLVEVSSAQEQVVAGMNYKLVLLVGESSTCKNDGTTGLTLLNCPVDQRKHNCEVVVWDQPWRTPRYQLTSFHCQPKQLVDPKAPGEVKAGDAVMIGVNSMLGQDKCNYTMFVDFQRKYNKSYGSNKAEQKRFLIFCNNMKKAQKLKETDKGTAQYGATIFADLTEDEFRRYVGKPWDLSANEGMRKAEIPVGPIPDAFDWRDHNAVTPVKNQGSCGSCWAFSTTGNIEGQWAIKKKELISLSEQELVDCDKVDEGCEGGLPSQAYKEIIRLGGLESESEYQYKGRDEKCSFIQKDVKVFINDSVAISSNENEMAAWLSQNGPISIGINAFAMQFYMGGISHPYKFLCNPKNLDHGVLIVGFGTQSGKPYWIIKNSWGESWGEKGYYYVYRGDGVCGLNTMCTSAVID